MKATKEPKADDAIRKLRETAIKNSPMQPIIETIFDIGATRAERNDNVRLFAQQWRQRINGMELKLAQMTGKPEFEQD